MLREIIFWTGGQPFLTQKLCQLILTAAQETSTGMITLPVGTEVYWVEQLVRKRIIQHWESVDEPEHLRTIRDRLLFNEQNAGRLLGLYQRVLQASEVDSETVEDLDSIRVVSSNDKSPSSPYPLVPTDDSPEQTELLLSGLVEKHNGYLRVKNPIYRSVFNLEWVVAQLNNLRPYSQTFNAWVRSGYKDESRLLRGQALRDAQKWAQGKSLSDLDYRFLAASQECTSLQVQMALEATRILEVEARLAQEKKTAKLQRFLLVAVLVGSIVSTGLAVGIFLQYRLVLKSEYQARKSEIQALVSSSEGLFASNRRLDALVEAIKATRRLQQINQADANIENQVKNALAQAVYGADEYNRLLGHKAAILAVAISPDSSVIASASIDNTVKLWRRDGSLLTTLTGHTAPVRAVNFSRDGKTLVSASDDRTVRIWRRDGTLLKTLTGHNAPIWAVTFSPDGQQIVSTSIDSTIKLWDRSGRLLKTLTEHKPGISHIAFSPDSQIFGFLSNLGDQRRKGF